MTPREQEEKEAQETKEHMEELSKTLEGRLTLTLDEMSNVHTLFFNAPPKQLAMTPQAYNEMLKSLQFRHAAALRQSICAITDALLDMVPRVKKIEAFLEEIANEPITPAPVNGTVRKERH